MPQTSITIPEHPSKSEYKTLLKELRTRLLEAQFDLQDAGSFPLILLINGIEGAGKGECVKLMTEVMDPRGIDVETLDLRRRESAVYPPAWRYWRAMPANGDIGVFFGNWYTELLAQCWKKSLVEHDFEAAVSKVWSLERLLLDNGALVIKCWFNLTKPQMKKRFKKLKKHKEQWRLTPLDTRQLKHYDIISHYASRMLLATQEEQAPWHLIDGKYARHRKLAFLHILLESLEQHLETTSSSASKTEPATDIAPLMAATSPDVIGALDLSHELKKKEYKQALASEQKRFAILVRKMRAEKRSLAVAFEGNDAAGKGGAIRRVTASLDPREYSIMRVGAPDKEALAHHFLWRFWEHVPAREGVTLFDRSWYGRVLVERVEKLTPVVDWQRSYAEINDFERQLTDAGCVVVKFWLAIDSDTQLERFEAREDTPYKRYKITDEDWRNRKKWDDYVAAVNDMVALTSTEYAPWTLVEANDKRFARVKVLRTINETLEKALD